MSSTLRPWDEARAVRPLRWMYFSTVNGTYENKTQEHVQTRYGYHHRTYMSRKCTYTRSVRKLLLFYDCSSLPLLDDVKIRLGLLQGRRERAFRHVWELLHTDLSESSRHVSSMLPLILAYKKYHFKSHTSLHFEHFSLALTEGD
jgi:hypothetical protein